MSSVRVRLARTTGPAGTHSSSGLCGGWRGRCRSGRRCWRTHSSLCKLAYSSPAAATPRSPPGYRSRVEGEPRSGGGARPRLPGSRGQPVGKEQALLKHSACQYISTNHVRYGDYIALFLNILLSWHLTKDLKGVTNGVELTFNYKMFRLLFHTEFRLFSSCQ